MFNVVSYVVLIMVSCLPIVVQALNNQDGFLSWVGKILCS